MKTKVFMCPFTVTQKKTLRDWMNQSGKVSFYAWTIFYWLGVLPLNRIFYFACSQKIINYFLALIAACAAASLAIGTLNGEQDT